MLPARWAFFPNGPAVVTARCAGGTGLSCATRASAKAALFVTALRCASCLT